ncbi:YraN family protein [Phnomibacter ginsenosidimutans]|uniref:YraN family protein n=1 Tax=Phnomibacter ginsenosidimutans TaxID=2676868 RepID=UPI0018D23449|nr:YraN family protein [Phnomibacter ginsenosidimutans]
MEKSAQHNNQHTGKRGEDFACHYLLQQGFEILQRNWRYKKTETDIIARREKVLHFIEVKTLNTPFAALPELKVNQAKLRQMKLGAAGYLEQQPQWHFIQFDILAIRFNAEMVADVLLIEDVF